MKLVIQTQFKENYGAHDWDGEGECPQYWKFKGGETYVFPNLIPNDVTRIRESGIPTLGNLIESNAFRKMTDSTTTMLSPSVSHISWVLKETESLIVKSFNCLMEIGLPISSSLTEIVQSLKLSMTAWKS